MHQTLAHWAVFCVDEWLTQWRFHGPMSTVGRRLSAVRRLAPSWAPERSDDAIMAHWTPCSALGTVWRGFFFNVRWRHIPESIDLIVNPAIEVKMRFAAESHAVEVGMGVSLSQKPAAGTVTCFFISVSQFDGSSHQSEPSLPCMYPSQHPHGWFPEPWSYHCPAFGWGAAEACLWSPGGILYRLWVLRYPFVQIMTFLGGALWVFKWVFNSPVGALMDLTWK